MKKIIGLNIFQVSVFLFYISMGKIKLIGKGAFSCAFMPGFNCKGKPVNNKVTKVTAEKPRAVAYIDDKGITFNNWEQVLGELKI